jgi:very-short-patch-repair endonuclease
MGNQYKIRTIKCKGCGQIITKRMPIGRKYCSLECWRGSKHPQRKTGKIVKCEWCGKEVYKPKSLLNYKHHFCSCECANKYQARNKLTFICKVCGKQFNWSKSRLKQQMPKYCSIECRNKDKDWIQNACIKGNLVQQNKKGLNKLELAGRKILQDLGVKFQEQVLMFNKFLVDVLIPDKKIIIQWDGDYWHNKAERNKLDKSQDAYLTKCGYKVIRIKESQIKNNREKTYDYLKRTI